jgi:hypothetical protein
MTVQASCWKLCERLTGRSRISLQCPCILFVCLLFSQTCFGSFEAISRVVRGPDWKVIAVYLYVLVRD